MKSIILQILHMYELYESVGCPNVVMCAFSFISSTLHKSFVASKNLHPYKKSIVYTINVMLSVERLNEGGDNNIQMSFKSN